MKEGNYRSLNDYELLADRLDDLENRVIELQDIELGRDRKSPRCYKSSLFIAVSTLVLLSLLGLSVNYSTENHQISYNNSNLLELAIGGLTLISGSYAFNKIKDNE